MICLIESIFNSFFAVSLLLYLSLCITSSLRSGRFFYIHIFFHLSLALILFFLVLATSAKPFNTTCITWVFIFLFSTVCARHIFVCEAASARLVRQWPWKYHISRLFHRHHIPYTVFLLCTLHMLSLSHSLPISLSLSLSNTRINTTLNLRCWQLLL